MAYSFVMSITVYFWVLFLVGFLWLGAKFWPFYPENLFIFNYVGGGCALFAIGFGIRFFQLKEHNHQIYKKANL